RGDSLENAIRVPLACVATYAETVRRLLKKGETPVLDLSSKAPVGDAALNNLIQEAAAHKRADFIQKLTEQNHGQRRFKRSLHYFNLPDNERDQALRLVEDYRRRMPAPPAPDFYEVQDVCGRVAGIGSMGRLRYAVLVNGKGNRDARNVILEFKEA